MKTEYEKIREKALKKTKEEIKKSFSADEIISQTISAIEELDKATNLLSRRLKEWASWYYPRTLKKIDDNKKAALTIINEEKETEDMGAEISEEEKKTIENFAKKIISLHEEREELEKHLEETMKKHCPNLLIMAGPTIGAKLIRAAGSLKKLASTQSSTIQLFGAEKALFRHLRTGSKPPKYGYIINHPIIIKTEKNKKGRAARALADKISIACRVDYFKGEPIGEKLLKELEERFS